jgi:hypothetical protein
VTAIIAHGPEMATAIATREFVRSVPEDAMLTGICAVAINPDFLRQAMRELDGGQRGEVLSLVQPAAADHEPPAA